MNPEFYNFNKIEDNIFELEEIPLEYIEIKKEKNLDKIAKFLSNTSFIKESITQQFEASTEARNLYSDLTSLWPVPHVAESELLDEAPAISEAISKLPQTDEPEVIDLFHIAKDVVLEIQSLPETKDLPNN